MDISQSGSDVTPKIVVGWRERVSLPDWGVKRIRAKIDTGARSSAIHVAEIEELDDGRLRFEVIVRERPQRKSVWVEATPFRETSVKPSHGKPQLRTFVRTRMQLGEYEHEIELSLVCRKGMLCRMLVGRLALGDRYLVDASRKYVVSARRKDMKR